MAIRFDVLSKNWNEFWRVLATKYLLQHQSSLVRSTCPNCRRNVDVLQATTKIKHGENENFFKVAVHTWSNEINDSANF